MIKLEEILKKIQSHKPQTLPETPVSAAVLVLLMQSRHNQFHFIITKRPETLATYAGHYCFPGGMREPLDKNLEFTAFRETEEELGLAPALSQTINQLDDFHDRYDNLVRPTIALIKQEDFEQHVRLSKDEVEKLYYFPLEDLKRVARDDRLEQLTHIQPTYSYTQGDVFIWGLTARILVHLGNILFDTSYPTTKSQI